MKQTGYERGSILDLAIISGGNVDCALSMCVINEVCLSDDTEIGREYDVNRLENIDTTAKKRIELESIKPATALSAEDMAACPYGGIGFMGIEIDFEVS